MQPFDVREGDTMVLLDSDAASGISGVQMLVDAGHAMSSASGWWEAYEPIMDLLMGRTQFPTGGRWGSDGG